MLFCLIVAVLFVDVLLVAVSLLVSYCFSGVLFVASVSEVRTCSVVRCCLMTIQLFYPVDFLFED